MKLLKFCISIFLLLAFFCCEKDNGDPDPIPEPDTISLKIHSFRFEEFDPVVEGIIDSVNFTIQLSIPQSGNIKSLTPSITFTDGAELYPPSGYAYDFTNPLTFTVSKNDSSLHYQVSVDYQQSSNNQLVSVNFPELYLTPAIQANTISFEVFYGTDLSEVLIEMQVSENATVSPESGSYIDLTSPVEIIVTAQNGEENTYTVTATELEQETAIRAFWIPATWHSSFLTSYDKIIEGVNMADELNFNTLYVCAWAQTRCLYPFQGLVDNSSYSTIEESLFSSYTGGTGSAIQDLITVAHDHGLKVILWYEYGFMAKWGAEATPDNDAILAVHPDWKGINNNGEASNYNNSDYYYNAYHPEVQQFLLNMVATAVEHYDIDGIQGDDRMPAMPRNSGYDEFTVNKYKAEHNGEEPPQNYNNNDWVRWRADILNAFAQRLYDTVKYINPECLVTSSPNPYPWAFQNLMQEWPVWLDQGNVEILSVQCYRDNISSYEYTINEVLSYFNSHGDGNLKRLVPGLILYDSSGLTDPDLLAAQIQMNREKGISGEAFFYDVPLQDDRVKKVIRAFYPGEALFPDF